MFQKVTTWAIWSDNVDVSVRRIGMNQRRNERCIHMYSIGILGYYNWCLLEEILIKVVFGRNQSENWYFWIPRDYVDNWIFRSFLNKCKTDIDVYFLNDSVKDYLPFSQWIISIISVWEELAVKSLFWLLTKLISCVISWKTLLSTPILF